MTTPAKNLLLPVWEKIEILGKFQDILLLKIFKNFSLCWKLEFSNQERVSSQPSVPLFSLKFSAFSILSRSWPSVDGKYRSVALLESIEMLFRVTQKWDCMKKISETIILASLIHNKYWVNTIAFRFCFALVWLSTNEEILKITYLLAELWMKKRRWNSWVFSDRSSSLGDRFFKGVTWTEATQMCWCQKCVQNSSWNHRSAYGSTSKR